MTSALSSYSRGSNERNPTHKRTTPRQKANDLVREINVHGNKGITHQIRGLGIPRASLLCYECLQITGWFP
jgi:hypothetical protein